MLCRKMWGGHTETVGIHWETVPRELVQANTDLLRKRGGKSSFKLHIGIRVKI